MDTAHNARHGKKVKQQVQRRRAFTRTVTALFVTLLVVGAAGYLFGRNLEGKLHGGSAGGPESSLAKELPRHPVTFLVIGTDSRGSDRGRSDTLMVMRINPQKKVATILSIPRDMRVDIPGHGTDKINAAYSLGGSELAIETVRDFTNLEINHCVEIDFQGFKRLVDALGGIDINVEKRIRDSFDGEYVDLYPGMHHFNGQEALAYVRVRHVDDDFGRAKRQQQFLRAVYEKALKPMSLTKLPQVIGIFSENVRMDSGMGIGDLLSYGQLFRSIPKENVHMATLPGVSEMIDGVSYVVPKEEELAVLLEKVQNDEPLEPGQPSNGQQQQREKFSNAEIMIDVQNGSGESGQGTAMASKLKAKGFTVNGVANADTFDYETTKIMAAPGDYEKAQQVKKELGFGEVATDNHVDSVTVIVGRDFSR